MKPLKDWLKETEPSLILAPMQDVTDLPFWRLMETYGGPDIYFTEYFRVHRDSTLSKYILESIQQHPPGKPVIAQMIGNDIPSLVRTAKELQQHDIIGIDLNLGCPAPIVYKKNAGGGLLRSPQLVDQILGALREAISINFTVKTRLGFLDDSLFPELLDVFARHHLDGLTVHARTVREGYTSIVHHDQIQRAVDRLHCPVIANGNIYSSGEARSVWDKTGAAGLMIGRGAIRNPWIFQQIKQAFRGETPAPVRLCDLREYVERLYHAMKTDSFREGPHIAKMKKYMNFIGQGVDPEDRFLFEIRRVATEQEFFAVCDRYLNSDEEWLIDLPGGFIRSEAERNLTCSG